MLPTRIATVLAGLTLIAVACGDTAETTDLQTYASQMQAIEADFLNDSRDLGPPSGDDYPLDDELVYFTHAFEILDTRVEAWKEISPPPELDVAHNLLDSTMEDVQRIVLDYAQRAALEAADFAMDEIAVDAEVVAASALWRGACRDLTEQSILLDAAIAFAGSCAVPTLTES